MIIPERDHHTIRALVMSSSCRCHVGDSDISCTQHLRDTKVVTNNDTTYFTARDRHEHEYEHRIRYSDQHITNIVEYFFLQFPYGIIIKTLTT